MVSCCGCSSRHLGHLRFRGVKPVTFEAFRISLAKFVKWLDDVVNVPQGADEEVNPNTYGSLERLVSITPPGSLPFVSTYNYFNLFFADLCRSNLNKM